MSQVEFCYHKTRIGELVFGAFKDRLCLLDFRYRKMRNTVDERIRRHLKTEFAKRENSLLTVAKQQFDEYLAGTRTEFDLPLLMAGTEFQKSVWQALMKVPYGATATYLQLAADIGDKKAVRAVAAANGANAIAVIIPCHRVIGSSGELVGYGGGLPAKKYLLKLESEGSVPQTSRQMNLGF